MSDLCDKCLENLDNCLQYYHVSTNKEDLFNGGNIVWQCVPDWDVTIDSSSIIECVDGNLTFERVGLTNKIKILPVPEERVVYGTIAIKNTVTKCYDEKTIYVNQDNGLWVYPASNPIRVSNDCCDENNNPKEVLKAGAFDISWSSWIKCVKVECFEPFVKAFITKSKINICVSTCEDLYDVDFYITGYDRCGNIIANTVVTVDIIHANVPNDCTGDCVVCKNIDDTICDDLCDEGCDEDPNGGIGDPELEDDIDEQEPGDEDEESEKCELVVKPTFFNIPYVKDRDSNFDAVMTYTSFSNDKNASLKFDDKVLTNAYGFINGKHIHTLTKQSILDCGANGSGFTTYFTIGSTSDCKKIPVRFEIEGYIKSEPTLLVFDEENNPFPNNGLLFFCAYEGGEADPTPAINDCDDPITADYLKTHNFYVTAGTATWYVYSYDKTIISCSKRTTQVSGEKKDILSIKLLDYDPIKCSEKQEIILKNSANQFFSIFFAVDENLQKDDEYKFEWEVDSSATYTDRYYYADADDRYVIATCANYYDYNDSREPFVLLSEYSLAIDGNNAKHTGNWSFISKGATYQIEKCVLKPVSNGSTPVKTWEVINNYYVISSYDNGESIDGWYDEHKGKITMYIGEKEVNDVNVNDIRIISKTSFNDSTEIENNGQKQSKCYIDFVQALSGLTVRLYIIHPSVVAYHIYTDQKGNVNVTAK